MIGTAEQIITFTVTNDEALALVKARAVLETVKEKFTEYNGMGNEVATLIRASDILGKIIDGDSFRC